MSTLTHATYLAFNFMCTVAIVFINKAIFASFQFRYTTALTALHYVITLLGLEVLAAVDVYERRSSPMTPQLFVLSAVVGVAPALNNLSLSLNNLGFYQVVKLLVTPAIIALEFCLLGRRISLARTIALLAVCVGVGAAVISDISVALPGFLVALCWVPVAALYKVLWSSVTKEEGWHTFALMRRVLPLSTGFIIALIPCIDPPGLLTFEWTAERGALVGLSGVAAFFVNWSGFLVMGACSALTHTLLGQLKACVIILGGFLVFAQRYPPKAIAGASVAVIALTLYTRINLAEQAARLHGNSSAHKRSSPPEEAAAATVDTEAASSEIVEGEHTAAGVTTPLMERKRRERGM